MLVLSVHENERIMIGNDIVITLVRNKGQQGARLGIQAPANVTIDREKIYLDKKRVLGPSKGPAEIEKANLPKELFMVDGRYWFTMDEVSYGPFCLQEAIQQLGDYKNFMGGDSNAAHT